MTTGYSVALRNAQLDAITAAAGSGAKLRLMSGTRPATGGTATTVLAEFNLGTSLAPAASGGVLTPTLPNPGSTGEANGTATWFRVSSSAGTALIDGSVGTSAADLIMSTTTVSIGAGVNITGWTITRGNP